MKSKFSPILALGILTIISMQAATAWSVWSLEARTQPVLASTPSLPSVIAGSELFNTGHTAIVLPEPAAAFIGSMGILRLLRRRR